MRAGEIAHRRGLIAMDTILVVNAGSSSVKFQVFALEARVGCDGRSRARWTGSAAGRDCAPAAPKAAAGRPGLSDRGRGGCSSRPGSRGSLAARRAANQSDRGRPSRRAWRAGYDRPVLIDDDVLAQLERYASLAPLHQPHNLAPIRTLLAHARRCRRSPASIPLFIATMMRLQTTTRSRSSFYAEGVRRYGFHGLSYEYVAASAADRARDREAGG